MALEELLEDEVTPRVPAALDLRSSLSSSTRTPRNDPSIEITARIKAFITDKSHRAELCDPKAVRLDFAALPGVSYDQICRIQSPFH